jgi:DNA-binding NarL/FixJ family response regulator
MDDRLFDLLATLSALRSNGQVLVDQIRENLSEMRKLQSHLRVRQNPGGEANGNGRLEQEQILQLQYGLTQRETQVARLLAAGNSNSAIARQLQISPHTARHHTQRVLSKLGVHSRAAAGARIRD